MHPAKLVYGLAETLTSMGVSIYEGSRVGSIENKTLTLNNGRVTAAKTFICTEGYSGQLLGSRTLIPDQFLDDRDQAALGRGMAADRLERAAVP